MKPKGRRRITDKERLEWLFKQSLYLKQDDGKVFHLPIWSRAYIDAAIRASREGKK